MSEESPETPKPNRPARNAQIQARGYTLSVGFIPPIRLVRRRGYEFAASLTDYLDPEIADLESHKWTFRQPLGAGNSDLAVVISPQTIEMAAAFPTNGQEWFEERFAEILRRFHQLFEPQLLITCKALVRATLQIDGDARKFLAEHVMKLEPRGFGRPIHLVGLRLFFPEVGMPDTSIEWQVNVRAESLLDDPTKLFLEADAEWGTPSPWGNQAEQTVVAHVKTVRDFLQQKVVSFLSNNSASGEKD